MERRTLGSELDGNPAERRAIWSRENSRFWRLHGQHTLSSSTTIWFVDFKVYSSTVVTTIVPRATLEPFWELTHSLPSISKRCSFREGGLHCGRCVFGEDSNALIVRSSTPSLA